MIYVIGIGQEPLPMDFWEVKRFIRRQTIAPRSERHLKILPAISKKGVVPPKKLAELVN